MAGCLDERELPKAKAVLRRSDGAVIMVSDGTSLTMNLCHLDEFGSCIHGYCSIVGHSRAERHFLLQHPHSAVILRC